MVMNKKEKATVEDLRLRLSLHWTKEVLPDVQPPTNSSRVKWDELSTGYMYNAYTLRIVPACSSCISHGVGCNDKTTAQQSLALYSTKELAAKAMRYAVELKCAKELRKVDQRIESILEESND